MNDHFRLSRRSLIAAGAATGALAATSSLGAGIARAQTSGPGRVIVLYLRGGQDHLSTVIPYTESTYYDQRPTVAIPDTQVLDLDGQFGFHPVMAGLHGLYQDGRVAAVIAAGNPAGNRSHFAAQDLSEFGGAEIPTDSFGWIGRHLNEFSASVDTPFRGISIGDLVSASLRGFPALGMSGIDAFGLGGRTGSTAGLDRIFRSLYAGGNTIERYGTDALDAAEQVTALTGSANPDPLLGQLDDLVSLLDADLGIEVATIDIGGWDTHNLMGTVDDGDMRSLLATLDGAMTHLQAGLDATGQSDVVTVVMTEFGRRVAENGSAGTDHGWGSAMFVVGDRAAGGIHGTWPGIAPADTGPRGDVVVTTDFRDVLGDVLRTQTGEEPANVFPDHTLTAVGVTVET